VNRDQQRAVSAYERVSQVGPNAKEKYGTLALKLPFLIRSSGLAQALTFVGEKAGAEVPLMRDLAATVGAATGEEKLTAAQLLARAREDVDAASYLMLTREVLRAASWYKRLASSVLKVQPGGDE
jgi:CRISPR-associated protein Cmr5